MNTKKSFLEILSSTISTFISSFWGIMGTWCFAIVATVAIHWIVAHIFNIPVNTFDKNSFRNLPLTTPVIILAIFNICLTVLLFIWQVLVIKNNIFIGVSDLFPALKKACSKSLKVFAILAILFTIFIIVGMLVVKTFSLHPSGIKIITAVLGLLFAPLVMLPVGVILHDTKFVNAITKAFGICFSHYFRILGFFILFFVMYLILIALIMIIFFIFKFLLILLFVVIMILAMLFYFTVYSFYTCFFVELYLDLATNEGGNIDDRAVVEEDSYTEITGLNQQPETSPKERTLRQEQQQVYKEEPPEGLKPLGGDYGDKK